MSTDKGTLQVQLLPYSDMARLMRFYLSPTIVH
jgi:hypothetical protein